MQISPEKICWDVVFGDVKNAILNRENKSSNIRVLSEYKLRNELMVLENIKDKQKIISKIHDNVYADKHSIVICRNFIKSEIKFLPLDIVELSTCLFVERSFNVLHCLKNRLN